MHDPVWLAHQMEQRALPAAPPPRSVEGLRHSRRLRAFHFPPCRLAHNLHKPSQTLPGVPRRTLQESAISWQIVGSDLVIPQFGKCAFSLLRSL